jgi:hypothetical protein
LFYTYFYYNVGVGDGVGSGVAEPIKYLTYPSPIADVFDPPNGFADAVHPKSPVGVVKFPV